MLKPGWGNLGPFAICWMLSPLIKIFSQRWLSKPGASFGDEPTLSVERRETPNFFRRNAGAEDHRGTQREFPEADEEQNVVMKKVDALNPGKSGNCCSEQKEFQP